MAARCWGRPSSVVPAGKNIVSVGRVTFFPNNALLRLQPDLEYFQMIFSRTFFRNRFCEIFIKNLAICGFFGCIRWAANGVLNS